MSKRTERVNEQLREEISSILIEDLRDPRIGVLVSVTHVDVAPDLRRATAFVSVLGEDAEREATMAALDHARPFIRRELARRLRHMRATPDVSFVNDRSIERGQQLTDIMRRTAEDRGDALA